MAIFAFSICTFWYVDARARSGRLEEARMTFEKMLTSQVFHLVYWTGLGIIGIVVGALVILFIWNAISQRRR